MNSVTTAISPPRQAGSTPIESGRLEQVLRIVDEVVERRDQGEYVADERLIESHQDLMPELGEELAVLRDIQLAALGARKAGPTVEPELLSWPELAQPIDSRVPGVEVGGDGELPLPIIQGYSLLQEITRGGQAVVFEAIQECTGRKVAVKVLLGGTWAASRSRRRFTQETQILGSLSHRHIVSILDAGRTADGSFFLVMPFVDGCSLDDYLAMHRGNHPEAVRDRLGLFIKIADAVGEAHLHGIVHRDLKPSNILVDRHGEPYVMDFGLALALRPKDLERGQPLTLTGQIVGSVPWFSPEQANGLKLDQRSDVYALGVLLYQSFSGDFPYPVFAAARTVLNHIVATVPLSIAAHLADYPQAPRLDAIVQKALAKAADARHANAAELAEDLRQLLASPSTVPTCVEPPAPAVPPISDRRRLGLLGIVVVGASVALALAISIRRDGRAPVSSMRPPASKQTVLAPAAPVFANRFGMDFAEVPAGTFVMGSGPKGPGRQDEEVQHYVTISRSFWMGAKPTTIRQYKAVMGNVAPFQNSADIDGPIVQVTWFETDSFCKELSRREHRVYRLPTEAEWEYAFRKSINAPGTPLDMQSGVKEWCADWYGPYLAKPLTDPQGAARSFEKVVRCGAANAAGRVNPAQRSAADPHISRANLGFRIVLEQAADMTSASESSLH